MCILQGAAWPPTGCYAKAINEQAGILLKKSFVEPN